MIEQGRVGRRSFKKTRMVGGLPFADDVRQEILEGEAAAKVARSLGIRFGKAPVFTIQAERILDREFLRQVWIQGDPWAAWTRSGVMEATLLP
jgi:hypothetical protein